MIAHRLRSPGLVVPLLITLIASCQSSPTRLFMLETVGGAPAVAPYGGPPLRVNAVHMPPSLDRIEIVTDAAPGELQLSELEHWAAPLGRLTRQTLTEDLAMRLPKGRVIFPHLPMPQGAIGLTVDILAFSADQKGARLEASWSFTSEDLKPESAHEAVSLRNDTPTAGAAATARALSALIAQLADRISADLLTAQREPPSGQGRTSQALRGRQRTDPRGERLDRVIVERLSNAPHDEIIAGVVRQPGAKVCQSRDDVGSILSAQ